jgi:hypothetical protein
MHMIVRSAVPQQAARRATVRDVCVTKIEAKRQAPSLALLGLSASFLTSFSTSSLKPTQAPLGGHAPT